jgi:RHS repeat-associated protein
MGLRWIPNNYLGFKHFPTAKQVHVSFSQGSILQLDLTTSEKCDEEKSKYLSHDKEYLLCFGDIDDYAVLSNTGGEEWLFQDIRPKLQNPSGAASPLSTTFPENFVITEYSIDSSNFKLNYLYDDMAKLTTICEVQESISDCPADSPQLNIEYATFGLIKSVSANGRNKIGYTYDTERRLSNVYQGDNGVIIKSYLYENDKYPFSLTRVSNSYGQQLLSAEYNDQNFVTAYSSVLESGRFIYDDNNKLLIENKVVGGSTEGSQPDSTTVSAIFVDNSTTYVNQYHAKGGVWKYDWTSDNKLAQRIEPNLVKKTFSYNDDGTLKEAKFFSHENDNEANPEAVNEYFYSSINGSPKLTGLITRDHQGIQSVIQGYDYRSDGKPVFEYSGKGASRMEPGLSSIEYTYDESGFPNQIYQGITDENGNITDKQLIVDYDYYTDVNDQLSFGRVQKITSGISAPTKIGEEAAPVTVSFDEYDRWGNLIQMTDERGIVSRFTYNNQNQVISSVTGVSLPAAIEITYDYNERHQLSTVHYPEGKTIDYTYDTFDRLTQISTNTGLVYEWHYNIKGQLDYTITPEQGRMEYAYDNEGRLNSIVRFGEKTEFVLDPMSQLSQKVVYTTDGNIVYNYRYDYDQRLISTEIKDQRAGQDSTWITTSSFCPAGLLTSTESSHGLAQQFEYDKQLQLIAIENLSKADNSPGLSAQRVDFMYDLRGRILSQTIFGKYLQHDYNDETGEETITEYFKDGTDRVLSFQKDASGNILLLNGYNENQQLQFEYDFLQRLVSLTDFGGKQTLYSYDQNSSLSSVDTIVNETTVHRQSINPPTLDETLVQTETLEQFNGANPDSLSFVYTYDSNQRLTKVEECGPEGCGDSPPNRSFDYDAYSRLTKETYPFLNRILQHEYDGRGNRTKTSILDSNNTLLYQFTYRYDGLGRPIEIACGDQLISIKYPYERTPDQSGYGYLIKEVELKKNDTLTHRNLFYSDEWDRLKTIAWFDAYDVELYRYEYSFDDKNRIASKSIYENGGQLTSEAYTYNDADMLEAMTSTADSRDYSYDKNANLLTANSTADYGLNRTLNYDGANKDQLTGATFGINYLYNTDESGRVSSSTQLVKKGNDIYRLEQFYLFDPYHRLKSIQTDVYDHASSTYLHTSTSEYDYYPGSRLRYLASLNSDDINTPDSNQKMLYDGPRELEQLDSDGQSRRLYLANLISFDERFGFIDDPKGSSPQDYFYVQDHQNTVNALLQNNSVTNRMQFSPEGIAVELPAGTNLSDFAYTGRTYEEAHSLYYYRGRYYAPTFMRFLNEDPLRSGQNWQNYVGGNVVNMVDPTGYVGIIFEGYENFSQEDWQRIADESEKRRQESGENFAQAMDSWIGNLAMGYVGGNLLKGLKIFDRFRKNNQNLQCEPAKVGREKTVLRPPKTGRAKNKLAPDHGATGSHTTFKRDPKTGKITNYTSWEPQTNPMNPAPWTETKSFDAIGRSHLNKDSNIRFETPHVHDPQTPGEMRIPEIWEIPR